jgi:hypothetical protein
VAITQVLAVAVDLPQMANKAKVDLDLLQPLQAHH